MQPGALPDRKIRILHRQLGQRRMAGPRPKRRIERRDLAHQDAHRPAVAHDVMHGQRDRVVHLFPWGQRRSSRPRSNGPRARSNRQLASSPAKVRACASRFLCGSSDRSTTGSAEGARPAGSPAPASRPARRRPCATPRGGARSRRGREPAPRHPAAPRRAVPRARCRASCPARADRGTRDAAGRRRAAAAPPPPARGMNAGGGAGRS